MTWPAKVKDRVVSEYQAGTPIKDIVDKCGVGQGTLYDILDARNIPRRQFQRKRIRLSQNFVDSAAVTG